MFEPSAVEPVGEETTEDSTEESKYHHLQEDDLVYIFVASSSGITLSFEQKQFLFFIENAEFFKYHQF